MVRRIISDSVKDSKNYCVMVTVGALDGGRGSGKGPSEEVTLKRSPGEEPRPPRQKREPSRWE